VAAPCAVSGVIKEVRAPNTRTVEFVLAQPYAALLTVLAHPALAVAKYSTAADGSGRFVGSGPYRIVDASIGRLALEAAPGYWGGQPKAERIVFLDVSADDQPSPSSTRDRWTSGCPRPRRDAPSGRCRLPDFASDTSHSRPRRSPSPGSRFAKPSRRRSIRPFSR
jgi:MarR-like DNA-binding transcriptional regulator SgrR of sgrS sRNA